MIVLNKRGERSPLFAYDVCFGLKLTCHVQGILHKVDRDNRIADGAVRILSVLDLA